MQYLSKKLFRFLFFTFILIFLSGFSSLDYTRKTEPLPNTPPGNPNLSLGIVVHANSTGMDVLADSSQNIRFSASKTYDETAIELLRSSSRVDHTPKKFKFIDKEHGFSSDNIYEFSMMFDYKNHQWDYIRFMPFCSVIEWVTEEKLRVYLNKWDEIFEKAGWKSDLQIKQRFTLPTRQSSYNFHRYSVWETNDFKAVISVSVRDSDFYPSYVPKAERKKIKTVPPGYIVFIEIYKKSQYPSIYKNDK